MFRYILKKLGRFFVILTHEDITLDSGSIKNVLIVTLPSEEHLNRAIDFLHKKFKDAEFNILFPASKAGLVSRCAIFRKAIRIDSLSMLNYVRKLEVFSRNKTDLIVILSLSPFLIWSVFDKFKAPKLLYNYCDEQYIVRRKSLVEFLRCKNGADKQAEEKNIFGFLFSFFIKIFKLINVCIYMLLGFLNLSFRKQLYAKQDIKRHNTNVI